jgi:hypothetical protein
MDWRMKDKQYYMDDSAGNGTVNWSSGRKWVSIERDGRVASTEMVMAMDVVNDLMATHNGRDVPLGLAVIGGVFKMFEWYGGLSRFLNVQKKEH